MKKLLLFLLLATSIIADGQVYHRMLNNTTWYLRTAFFGGSGNLWICPIYDTVISGTTFKKYVRFTTTGSQGESCFLREDSTLKKVYIRSYYFTGEKVLYDFSPSVGQTATFYITWFGGDKLCHLDSVGTISTCYGNRKVQTWSFTGGYQFFAVEQFGTMDNDPTWVYYPGDPYVHGICKFEGGNSCYYPEHTPNSDPTSICPATPFCGVTGISEPSFEKSSITIRPNPTQNFLTVSSSTNERIESIEIFDIVGQLVKRIDKVGSQTISTIDVSDFQDGTYLLQLVASNGQTVTTKFIKQAR